jgi:hypothetical protein
MRTPSSSTKLAAVPARSLQNRHAIQPFSRSHPDSIKNGLDAAKEIGKKMIARTGMTQTGIKELAYTRSSFKGLDARQNNRPPKLKALEVATSNATIGIAASAARVWIPRSYPPLAAGVLTGLGGAMWGAASAYVTNDGKYAERIAKGGLTGAVIGSGFNGKLGPATGLMTGITGGLVLDKLF